MYNLENRKEKNFSFFIIRVLWGLNERMDERSLCNHKELIQREDTINIYSLNAQGFFIIMVMYLFCFSPKQLQKNVSCISVMLAFRPLLHQSHGQRSIDSSSLK